MASNDVVCIINLLKSVGDAKLASEPGRSSRSKTSKPGDTEDNSVKEVQPYILECFTVLVKNITEREDLKRQELKAELTADFDTKLAAKDVIIKGLEKKIRENQFSIDAQAQYNRSENFKIHGIEYKKGENTNEIVKEVAKYCGVQINDADLSTSHRLMSKEDMDKQINPSNRDTKIPPIIVRVNRRDLKTDLLEAKKTITTPAHLKNAIIYEDVTPLRSRIMYHLRQRNDKQAFRYVWSKGGRIYARTPEHAALPRDQQPRPLIINTPDDLSKAGFSEKEIEDIINNVRN